MKVLAINSSPRKPSLSKTSLMLQHLVQGMRDAGAQVDAVDIHDRNIEYCTACFACFNKRFNQTEVCIHDDDMTRDLLPKWRAANLVVYASPVFFHSVTAKLKAFLERTLPVYVSFGSGAAEGTYNPAGETGHPALAFLAVSGSPEDSAFDDYAKYAGCFDPVAEIYRNGSTLMSLPFCKERVADIFAATRIAGAELVHDLRISAATMARIRQPLHDDAAFIATIADAHQTLLPGHRALMTFPTEARRELRKLPPVAAATTPQIPIGSRRRTIGQAALQPSHDQALAGMRAAVAGLAAPESAPVKHPTPGRSTASPPASTDIAVIGMSGRFAAAADLRELWQVLETGRNLVEDVTRWDLRSRYAVEPGYGHHGGLLPAIDQFDALFFKIAGTEARYMDPQQRIFLEESWHALEDAGYASETMSELRCGVYAGCGDGDYRELFAARTPPQAFWGNAASVIPARIAYYLNLKGPAVAIDTACSSSLVAVHIACQALRSREVDMAISGGVFVQCTPRLFDASNNAGMLSPTGRCHTFDARADGFVIGEGGGAVILKRLDDALADRDHIHGVIKASGTNQDGTTNGLTAPSALSQQRLVTEVHDAFGVDPETIQFVECHGTGTKLGDPIEFNALAAAFRSRSSRQRFCAIGSIKTNIGHAGAAAGTAGLMKILLALRHGKLPASLHFETANPLVRLDDSPFFVNTALIDWPAGSAAPRRAGLSSFGFSGTNAHLVIEAPPPRPHRTGGAKAHLIALSARNPDQLKRVITLLLAHLGEAIAGNDLSDISFTLLAGRKHGKCRFACVVRDRDDLRAQLYAANEAAFALRGDDTSGDLARESAGNSLIDLARDASGTALRDHLHAIAGHYRFGDDLQYHRLFPAGSAGRIPLPLTPFDRRSHWAPAAAESTVVDEVVAPPPATPAHAGTLAAGDTLLMPVLEAIEPHELVPPNGPGVILMAPDGDPELLSAFRLEDPALAVIQLDEGLDDDALRRLLDRAVAGASRLIWVAPEPRAQDGTDAAIAAVQERGVLLLFRTARALLDGGHGARPLDWVVLTRQTASVHGETTHPDQAAITGLVGSLAKEVQRWTMRVADVPAGPFDSAGLLADIGGLPLSASDTVFYARSVGGRRRQWYRRRLLPVAAGTTPTVPPYRHGGVFVVLGGAGGIGRTWTEHVVRHFHAKVVWIGRRPINPEIEAELDRIATFGPRPHYISADCTRADEIERARDEIRRRFGSVNGLVHSAIVLRDGVVANLSTEAFRDVLAPKIGLSVNALRAFRSEPLDFVLFFSSMITFTASAGQSNYAAGCAFKDAFAERIRQELACPVKVMNWGYWGHVGIVSGPSYRERMAQLGVASIEADEAMQAVSVLLTSGRDRLVFLKTARTVEISQIDASVNVELAPVAATRPSWRDVTAATPSGAEIEALQPQLRILRDIEQAVAPLVVRQLARSGPPQPAYLKDWLRETEALLAPLPADVGDAEAAWEHNRDAWAANPEYAARCGLVDATLRALPRILAGETAATDALFPGGSMHLVEGLYRQNLVADAFNRWVAEAVLAEVECLTAGAPAARCRILEIGAGTGGTTAAVLQRLQATGLRGRVAEYAYTDVSSAFLRHARTRFGAANPGLTFHTLDIESTLADQGIEELTFDVVIAANVLHATRRIRDSVRHAKTALKPGGLLLLNELSRHTLLTHLTFGLLRSWWAASDWTLRLPGGPALSPEAWKAALTDEGFLAVTFPASEAHAFGQQIVMARSDGAIRRSVGAARVAPAPEQPAPPAAAVPHDSVDVAMVEGVVLATLSECLGVEASAIDADEAFADYGLDSLNAVQLVQALNERLGCSLKPSELYSHSTAARLAQHIERTRPVAPPPSPAPAAGAASAGAPIGCTDSDAIAVIGMSGRFGSARTLDELWQALLAGRSLVSTSTRWAEPQPGAFLNDIASFDAGFFNISGLEATYMDPQQRCFLEEAWKAIEDAGYAGDAAGGLRGRDVGVFAGCYPSDYFQFADASAPAQAMWGAASSIIPARLSYFLDLRGPAVAVDTACSSSLVAVHLACRSLLAGDCEMAIAGGVALQSTPRFFDFARRAGMLSASGRCHAFEARADGFVAGEGVAAVLLKPLARAIADGDHIHGVIRRTELNQDGASNGIIAPNGEAQLRLLRKTYAAAGIAPSSIQLLEAHGTGTKLGDPIEFDALLAHFGSAQEGACSLGSIKANIGHTLAAAGIAGLLKVLLALRHRTLPPAPDFRAANPSLSLRGSPFVIDTVPRAWPVPADRSPRRGAVSSFGFSGTNAHVIVEQGPSPAAVAGPASSVWLFVLTAASRDQLRALAVRVAVHCREADPDLAAMSFTLAAGRRHLAHRLACVAGTRDGLLGCLDAWLGGRPDPAVFEGTAEPPQMPDPRRRLDVRNRMLRQDTSGMSEAEQLNACARLFVAGRPLPVEDLYPAPARRRIPLPTYPFAAEHYWAPEPVASRSAPQPFGARAAPQPMAAERQPTVTPRKSVIWHATWQLSPISPAGTNPPGRVVVLATPRTHLLAQRISRHLPGSLIADAAETQPIGGFDVVIDCAGCAPIGPGDLDWLAWPRELARPGREAPGHYFCLTRGLTAVDPGDTVEAPDGRVARAALARMLQNEYRRMRSVHIDLARAASDDAVVDGLLAELSAAGSASEIAYREKQRFVPVLTQLEPAASDDRPLDFSGEHVLLITGGTRGLGLLCARHFATRYGVKRMVLSGRQPVPALDDWAGLARTDTAAGRRCRAYLALQQVGVALDVMALDLSDDDAVREAVGHTVARLGPIGGLLHCAGVADTETAPFIRKTAEGIGRVLEPKTIGFETLWRVLDRQPLGFAVLFSSLTAAVPAMAVGQSDYAMANAYLDAFARHHLCRTDADGPVVISAQWPNWKESGMGEVSSQALRASGFASLTNAEGLALLDRMLLTRAVPVMLPAVMLPATPAASPAPLAGAAPVAGTVSVDAWLAEIFATDLRIPRARLKPDTPFHDFGVDSILLAQIQQTIERQLGCKLDPSLLYTANTLGLLANWLREHQAREIQSNLAADPVQAPSPQPIPATPGDAIAVVGMACRFPGGGGLDGYWDLLRCGGNAIAPIPVSRWGLAAGAHAGLLDEIDQFDPEFFALPDADARAMSAQARIALEVALATFCHAGYRPEEVKGQAIGVYLGARGSAPASDDDLARTRHPVRAAGQNYLAAGISHYFDLHGPGMVIDTACSSALVAMQGAIHAMRSGDVDAALVGGVSILDTDGPLRMFRQRGLANDSGAFHVFDGRANGVILGEGCGMVLLKPLEQARRDGDTVYALVDSIAVNSDGRTAGPGAPNIDAQIAVMKAALRRGGRAAAEISHIEVNASGSEVSDLLELKAILAAYGSDAAVRRSLGSIKPNIGHPLCAEGIASFIKVVCMLHYQTFTPFLSAREPMRHFDFAASPFTFTRTAADWFGSGRVAAVNAFADGGTNAHAILSAWTETPGRTVSRSPLPLPLLHRRSMLNREAEPVERPRPVVTRADAHRPAANFWMAS